jgi:cytochrome c553
MSRIPVSPITRRTVRALTQTLKPRPTVWIDAKSYFLIPQGYTDFGAGRTKIEFPAQRSFTVKLNRNNVAVFFLAAAIVLPAFAQSGPDTYKSKCLMCHGVDGLAATNVGKAMKIPSFKDPAVVKATDAQLIAIIKGGKGKMQPYAGKITDDQIKSLVAYIRTLQK